LALTPPEPAPLTLVKYCASKEFAMSKVSYLVVLLVGLSLALGPAFAAQGSATKNLAGTYTWEDGNDKGDLKATFVPLGDGRWRVVFRAGTAGTSHVYSGNAEGKFGEGVVKGRVQLDADLATGSVLPFIGDLTAPGQAPAKPEAESSDGEVFTFQGEFKDGRFIGTHASVVDGKEERTGTMNLSEVK
jgi:hypothetical protein